jgi:hypothetical protein
MKVERFLGFLRFDDELDRGGILADLRSDRRGTVGTQIFIFIALRQDQE